VRSPTSGALAVLLATLALWVYLATGFLVRPCAVAGNSMEPGLEPGDRLLVDLWTYHQREPRPGEVVLFAGPGGDEMIKRVVRREAGGEGLWVLGDNRRSSIDSRRFGPVSPARVRGRAVWRYWPPSRMGPLRPPVAYPATAGGASGPASPPR